MPYRSNEELPPSIRSHLPRGAQDTFREAFNQAWITYCSKDPDRLEEIAHRVAWAAVKRRYRKVDSEWLLESGERTRGAVLMLHTSSTATSS